MNSNILTQDLLKEYLRYDCETGIFYWIKQSSKRIRVGAVAGNPDGRGYLKISFTKSTFRLHRLAWLYVYGEFPSKHIDHINGVRDDNRIINLRLATISENNFNSKTKSTNTSGFKGVSYRKDAKKWEAKSQLNGKKFHLGYFDSPELASGVYQDFCKLNHKEFFRI